MNLTFAPLYAMTALNFAQAALFLKNGNPGMAVVNACYGVACIGMVWAAR